MTHKLTFLPANVTVEVDPAHLPPNHFGKEGSILDIALANGVQLEHACGGAGVCGTCHVIVNAGMENLSAPEDDEMDVVDQAPNATLTSRLACQAVVKGDVTVTVPGWNRNAVSEKH
ncbi:MAG: 2Fe-2S iron-sulfur cluster-binding protein [Phycisphaerae bacterium]